MKQIKEFFIYTIDLFCEGFSYIKEDMQSNKLSDILEGLMMSSVLLFIGIGMCFILFMFVIHPIMTLFAIFSFIFIACLIVGVVFSFGYSLAWIIRLIRNLIWRKKHDSQRT